MCRGARLPVCAAGRAALLLLGSMLACHVETVSGRLLADEERTMAHDPLRQFFCNLYGVNDLTTRSIAPLRYLPAPNVVFLSLASTTIASLYSWNIPNDAALAEIARHSPIVEVGPMTGYWARRLKERGAVVTAYDKQDMTVTAFMLTMNLRFIMVAEASGSKAQALPARHCLTHMLAALEYMAKSDVGKFHWHPVVIAEGEEVIAKHPDEALLLGWPDNPCPALSRDGLYAERTLAAYRGNRVLYIGTWDSKDSASDGFHEALERDWICEKVIPVETGLVIKLKSPVSLYSLRRK